MGITQFISGVNWVKSNANLQMLLGNMGVAGGGVSPNTVFIPFHFFEACANVLTIDALDPVCKISEY